MSLEAPSRSNTVRWVGRTKIKQRWANLHDMKQRKAKVDQISLMNYATMSFNVTETVMLMVPASALRWCACRLPSAVLHREHRHSLHTPFTAKLDPPDIKVLLRSTTNVLRLDYNHEGYIITIEKTYRDNNY